MASESSVNSRYGLIVPPDIQEELQAGSKQESEFLWLIGDRAMDVLEAFKVRQDKGDPMFANIQEGDVYRAISYYCGKGVSRVRELAYVSREIPPDARGLYAETWSFGYFERVARSPYLREVYDIFEFLEEYRDGDITHPLPGRVLGVGEFMFLYESQIVGRNVENKLPDQPESRGYDLAQAATNVLSFQGLISEAKRLKRRLLGTGDIDRPNVRRVLELTDELEKTIPQAMIEMGMMKPAKDLTEDKAPAKI